MSFGFGGGGGAGVTDAAALSYTPIDGAAYPIAQRVASGTLDLAAEYTGVGADAVSALEAAYTAGYRSIKIRPQDYVINRTWTVPADLTLLGPGDETARFLIDPATHSTSGGALEIGQPNVHIEGIYIDGQFNPVDYNAATSVRHIIRVTNANRLTLKGVTIKNTPRQAVVNISAGSVPRFVLIDEMWTEDTSREPVLLMNGYMCRVLNSTFLRTGDDGVALNSNELNAAIGCIVQACHFYDVGYHTFAAVAVKMHGFHCLMKDCVVGGSSSGMCIIKKGNPVGSPTPRWNTVSGNNMLSLRGTGTSAPLACVDIEDGNDNLIKGNVLNALNEAGDGYYDAIRVRGARNRVGPNRVTGGRYAVHLRCQEAGEYTIQGGQWYTRRGVLISHPTSGTSVEIEGVRHIGTANGANAADFFAYCQATDWSSLDRLEIKKCKTSGISSTLAFLDSRTIGRVVTDDNEKDGVPYSAVSQSSGVGELDLSPSVRTTTQFSSASDASNTTGKYAGKKGYNSTTGKRLVAAGPGATDPWTYRDGTAGITPS